MWQSNNSLDTLATTPASTLNSLQLSQILNTEAETLNVIQKCWGHGYVFTKISHDCWSINKYHFVESDWFIDYSPLHEALVNCQ